MIFIKNLIYEPRTDHFTISQTVLTLWMVEYYNADLLTFGYVTIQSHISIENHRSTVNKPSRTVMG